MASEVAVQHYSLVSQHVWLVGAQLHMRCHEVMERRLWSECT